MVRTRITVVASILAIVGNGITGLAIADGNSLLEECQTAQSTMEDERIEKRFEIGWCYGFVNGVSETLSIYTHADTTICLPRVTVGQLTRVLVKYLTEHPEQLHEQEVLLTLRAFRAAFPCKNSED